jgi:SAM-dependent methyltransferase
MDAIGQFKDNQKKAWSSFAPTESVTGTAAPKLVKFSGVKAGATVLDVGCGTGVVALAAARVGAKVTGVDLTPALLDRARENAALTSAEVDWKEGDAEELPFADASFDFVLSQFGHMFAPRPEVATREMLRVLRPGGTIAFSTWPPELFTGRFFAIMGKYAPSPPPAGVSPAPQWGDQNIVRERLGAAVRDLTFARDRLLLQALSPQHARLFFEANVGPLTLLVRALESTDTEKLSALRRELEQNAAVYFEDNHVRQDFLMTRATKA